jgi:hypothetical protein
MSEDQASVVVPVDLLQSLLQEVHSLREEVQDLKEKIAALDAQQLQDIENLALDIAHDRQRITKLEAIPEPKEPSRKVAEHFDEIVKALLAREKQCKNTGQKWDYMAFWEVEELLGLSHRRVSQLADIARNDPRFAIGWHPRKKNMKVFRLNHFTLGDMACQLHKVLKDKK